MLTRDVFKQKMQRIRQLDEEYEKMMDALLDADISVDNNTFYNMMILSISLLEELMENKNEDISYFIFELDWGKSSHDSFDIEIDDDNDKCVKQYRLKNLDCLFDYLTEQAEHDKNN